MTREERLLTFPEPIREFLPRIWDAWNARKAAEPKRPHIEHSWTAEERQLLIDGIGRTDADISNELGLPIEQVAYKRLKLHRAENGGVREWLDVENEALREFGPIYPLRVLRKVFKADPQTIQKQMKELNVPAYVQPSRKKEPDYPSELIDLEKQLRDARRPRLILTGEYHSERLSVYKSPDRIFAELTAIAGV